MDPRTLAVCTGALPTLAMSVLAVRACRTVGSLAALLAPLGAVARPRNPSAMRDLKARLARAGWRDPEHVDVYLGVHLLLRAVGLLAAALLALHSGPRPLGALAALAV